MDWKAFQSARFEPRQEFVEIPELAEFFPPESGKPGFLIRGLTGTEWAKAKQPSQKDYLKIFTALMSVSPDKIIEGLKEIFDPETPVEMGTRIMLLFYGLVDEKLKEGDRLEICIKLNKTFPHDFLFLTNKIMSLTGMGHEVKKKL